MPGSLFQVIQSTNSHSTFTSKVLGKQLILVFHLLKIFFHNLYLYCYIHFASKVEIIQIRAAVASTVSFLIQCFGNVSPVLPTANPAVAEQKSCCLQSGGEQPSKGQPPPAQLLQPFCHFIWLISVVPGCFPQWPLVAPV